MFPARRYCSRRELTKANPNWYLECTVDKGESILKTLRWLMVAVVAAGLVFAAGFYWGRTSTTLSQWLPHPQGTQIDFSKIFGGGEENSVTSSETTPEPVITVVEEEYVNPFEALE